jgi:pilus assembly protein Flp/PilA
MINAIQKLANSAVVKSQKGVTAIEYGLLAALIALAIVGAITLLGTTLSGTFTNVQTHLPGAGGML